MLRSQSHIFLQPKVPNSIKSFLRSEQNLHRRSQQDMSSSSRVSTPLSYSDFSSLSLTIPGSTVHTESVWTFSDVAVWRPHCTAGGQPHCFHSGTNETGSGSFTALLFFHCLEGDYSASCSPTASLLSTPWVQPRQLLRRLSSLLRQRNNAMHSAREKRRTADPDNRKGIAVHCSSTQPYLNCQPQCPRLSANLPAIS